MTEGMNRKYEVKTNRRGEFIQIGLQPGVYKVTASKDGMSQAFDQQIGLDMAEVNFTLKPGSKADVVRRGSKKAEAKNAAIAGRPSTRASGSSNAGQLRRGDRQVQRGRRGAPEMRRVLLQHRRVQLRARRTTTQAEAAYKKAIEVDPNYVEAVYRAGDALQRSRRSSRKRQRDERARRASIGAPAAAAVSAERSTTRGSIAWNAQQLPRGAGDSSTRRSRPTRSYADATSCSGMVYINLGKLPEAVTEFETYLKLAPTGPNAKEAQTQLRRAQVVPKVAPEPEQRERCAAPRPLIKLPPDIVSPQPRGRPLADRGGCEACRPSPSDVTLVAVSKTFGADQVRAAYAAGQRDFGENKVQEGAAEDRRNVRYSRCPVAPDRPSAVEQSTQGRRRVRMHPFRRLDRPAEAVGRGRRRAGHEPRGAGAGGPGRRNHEVRAPAKTSVEAILREALERAGGPTRSA